MEYPKAIKDAVKVLCEQLEISYPKAFQQTYDSFGFPVKEGSIFRQRMEMGIYIELLKAGVFENVRDSD